MLNHAIDNLTTAEEDAYLTHQLGPFAQRTHDGRRCHFGVRAAAGTLPYLDELKIWLTPRLAALAFRFDALCIKLGGGQWRARVNAPNHATAADLEGAAKLGVLIRSRILSNRARRTLQPVGQPATVEAL